MSNLWEFLAQLPAEFGYDPSRLKEMRAHLRRRLFAEAAGQHIDFLFAPHVDVLHPKPTEWLGTPRRSHTGHPCVRRLKQGEPAYRCFSCGLDDTCVLCQFCFKPEDHKDHDVFMRITHRDDGGICDCGDDEAWKVPLHCASQDLEAEAGEVPQQLLDTLETTVQSALDFCIDIMSASHSGVQFINRATDIVQNFNESTLDDARYGPDIMGDGRYILTLWNDERRSFFDATIAIQLATQKNAKFGIMVARRIDAYGRGIIKVSSDLNNLLELKNNIQLFTATIRSVRDYMREEMVDEIIHWILDLSWARLKQGPAITLRKIIGKAMCDPWVCGNAHLNAGHSFSMDMPLSNPLWHNSSLDGVKIPRLEDRVAPGFVQPQPATQQEDLLDFDNSGMTFNSLSDEPIWTGGDQQDHASAANERGISPRFKYLIFFDLRFWKSLRYSLQDLYVSSLISNRDLKTFFGMEYADMYPQISELYVLLDREPEVSCIGSLSTQLFTTPSIATELARGPHISQYIASLFTLLTLQKIGPLSCITQEMKLDADSSILKNRRFGQLFHEIAFILSRNTEKQNVVASARKVLEVADFLSLCQGLSPVKRQTDKHIEFESEGWVYVFTTIPFVLQLGQSVAVGAFECTFDQTKEPIALVARLLFKWAVQYMHRAQNKRLSWVTCSSSYAGQTVECNISGYDCSEGIVSFHHPVHAFLSFLLQNCHLPNVAALKEILFGFERENAVGGPDQEFCRSILFEHPIQCLSVLSQVHVGLWVRNGYTMRSQLHHYRENTLRELAYAQDIFMAQVALVSLDTNVAFTQLVKRWNLHDWKASTLYDENQRYYMLEEFLHTLNTLLVDRIYLQDKSQEKINSQYYRREIIQTLTFMDMPYSEICRFVPEPMVADDDFDLTLGNLTTFTPPKGTNDVGMYSLNPELYVEFNPHYTHFSSARIEEAERAIAKRISDYQGIKIEDVVHIAPLQKLEGPWVDLGAFTRSVAFASFMDHLFTQLVADANQSNQADVETVLNSAIYLLIMAAKDDELRDKSQSVQSDGVFGSLKEWITAEHNGASFFDKIQGMLCMTQFSAVHVRLRKLCELLDLDYTLPAAVTPPQEEPDERKNMANAAKARIMEEMRAQRQKFKQQQQQDDVEMLEEDQQDDSDGTTWSFTKSNCVLCHMPENDDSIFGQMTFTCKVSIMRAYDEEWARHSYGAQSSLDVEEPQHLKTPNGVGWWKKYWAEDDDTRFGPGFPQDKIHKDTVIISGCGHGLHYSCYRDYLDLQSNRSSQQMRLTAEDGRKGEYLCPLCRAVNNGFIPIIWGQNKLKAADVLGDGAEGALDTLNSIEQHTVTKTGMLLEPCLLPRVMDNLKDTVDNALKLPMLEQIDRVRGFVDAPDATSLQHFYSIFANSVRTLEIALRGKAAGPYGGIIVDQLTGKHVRNLRVTAHYTDALTLLFKTNAPKLSGIVGAVDPLEFFIANMFWYCPQSSISVASVLRLAYFMAVCQQMKLVKRPDMVLPEYGELHNEHVASLLATLGRSPEGSYGLIARNVTIFLRRCALVLFGLSGCHDEDEFKFMTDQPEHARLCLYLNLPSLDDTIIKMAEPGTDEFRLVSMVPDPITEFSGIYKLIHLPPRLDCFYNARDSTEDFPVDPAICLFCGSVIPFQFSLVNPNEEGQCTKHTQECTKNYGLFILPRRNFLFLSTNKTRGTFVEAPYLDMHGEPDETRRGRVHFLHPTRADNITRKLWLENEIFDVVTRKLDQNVDYGGWETI